ncbi:unnamed protein product [Rhizoctonia solani]|uniref:DUF6532 domain-containing protein n=1 Tax=Rhizoctonia solani TaxID=456999 RepID=A0A8H3C8Z2_9AGAM|nr:unnamed protein product [Rhizoctonia solani]
MSKMKQAKHSMKHGKRKCKDMPKISQHRTEVKMCKLHSEVLRCSKAECKDFSLDVEESSEELGESNVESDLPDANMEESELERIWAEGKQGKKKLFSQATKVKADGPAQQISSLKKLSHSQCDQSPSPKHASGPLKGKREGHSEKPSAKHVRSQSLSTHSRVSSARSSSRASTACSSSRTPSTLDDCNDDDDDDDDEDKEEVKGHGRDSDSDDSDVRGESDDQDSDSRGESDEDSDGPQKRKTKKAKSGDYKGIEREILDRMVLSLQLFLVTEDYFPSPQQLVEVSTMKWEDVAGLLEAYRLKGVKQGSPEAISIVDSFLPHNLHRKPSLMEGTRYFQHKFLRPAACKMLFSGHKPLGKLYPETFEKFPLKTLAIMCAIIHGVLEAFKVDLNTKMKKKSQGESNQDKMLLASVQEYYRIHHKSTCSFEKYQSARCKVVLPALYRYCIEHSGGRAATVVPAPRRVIQVLTAEHFANDDLSPEELAEYSVVPSSPKRPRTKVKPKPKPRPPPNDEDDEVDELEGREEVAPLPPTVANSSLNKTESATRTVLADKLQAVEPEEDDNAQLSAAPGPSGNLSPHHDTAAKAAPSSTHLTKSAGSKLMATLSSPALQHSSATTHVLASPFTPETPTPAKRKRKAASTASVSPAKRKRLAESDLESPSRKRGGQSNSDAVSAPGLVSTSRTTSASDSSKSPSSCRMAMSVVIQTKARPVNSANHGKRIVAKKRKQVVSDA